MKSGLMRKYSPAFVWVMKLLDVLFIFGASYLVYWHKFDTGSFHGNYFALWLSLGVLTTLSLHIAGIYHPLRGQRFIRIAIRIWIAVSASFMTLLLCFFLFKISASFSRQWILVSYVSINALLIIERLVLHRLLSWMRSHDYNARHIIIVGAGDHGQKVAEQLKAADWSGYKIKAFWSPEAKRKRSGDIPVEPLPKDLQAYLDQNQVDEIWLALSLADQPVLQKLIEELSLTTVNIRLIPDLFGMRLINHSISEIGGVYTVNVRETPIAGVNFWVKELEDKVLASLILLLISPVLIALAIGVKLSSPGPVFYRQERVSWNNRRFNMLKFRSMPVNTEAKTGAVWATSGEQRATMFGAFMRKTSLDELPQFINVLLGDMSIVGPRPERPVFVDQFKKEIPGYMQKHMMKAGITGWAQVNGWRGDTDLAQRIEHDLYYIENWSLWLDFKIIFLTLFKGFVHRNAY